MWQERDHLAGVDKYGNGRKGGMGDFDTHFKIDRNGGSFAPSNIIYILKYPRQLVDLIS
jgi:hypothetical protein